MFVLAFCIGQRPGLFQLLPPSIALGAVRMVLATAVGSGKLYFLASGLKKHRK